LPYFFKEKFLLYCLLAKLPGVLHGKIPKLTPIEEKNPFFLNSLFLSFLDTLSFYFVLDFDFSQRKADRLYIACACSFRHEINKFFLLLILSSSNCLSSIIIRELKLEELKSLDFERIELLLKVLGEKDKKIEKENIYRSQDLMKNLTV